MKTVNRITGLVFFFLMAGGTALFGQYGRGAMAGAGNMWLNIPNLTDKQKTGMTAIVEKNRAEMDLLRKEMWEADTWEKKDAAAKKMQDMRLSHRKGMLNILTDEQKDQIILNNGLARRGGNAYGPGRGRGLGMGPCGGGFGPGAARGRGMGAGAGYGTGRGPGRGMAPGMGWSY